MNLARLVRLGRIFFRLFPVSMGVGVGVVVVVVVLSDVGSR